MPSAVSHQGVPNGSVPDQIAVRLSSGVFIGMERRGGPDLFDRDIRRKKAVQGDQQLVAGNPAPGLKIRRLTQGVNAGVGP